MSSHFLLMQNHESIRAKMKKSEISNYVRNGGGKYGDKKDDINSWVECGEAVTLLS